MSTSRTRTISLQCCVCLLAMFVGTDAPAAFVPVIGGPEYDSSSATGFRDQTHQSESFPFAHSQVNGNGDAVGVAHKYVAGANKGISAIVLHGSGSPITELDSSAIFGSYPTINLAYAINESGASVGSVYGGATRERPVRWDASGAVTELGVLETRSGDGVSTWGQAFAINNGGTVVGYTDRWGAGFFDRAVRWDAGSTIPIELGELPHGPLPDDIYPKSRAYAINESNTAVGWAESYNANGRSRGMRPVRWDGSGTAATELGIAGLTFDYRADGEAFDINESGTAVGWTNFCAAGRCFPYRFAVRWDAGSTAATQLEAPGYTSFAFSINDAGTAVGSANFGGYALRWDAGGTAATVLGGVGTITGGEAYDINNSGVAVGYVANRVEWYLVDSRAVAWRSDAVAIDLNTLIDPSSGWTLTRADSISDTGWITGVGSFDPDGPGGLAAYDRLFLLQLPQVPEPATWSLLTLAVLTTVSARPHRTNNGDTFDAAQ